MPFGVSFISTNLKINCKPVVNKCLGGCGIRFLGYKRHTCPECTIPFTIQNIDTELNNSLRSELKNCQPTVITLITNDQFLEILNSNLDPDFKKLVISDMLRGEEFLKDTTVTW